MSETTKIKEFSQSGGSRIGQGWFGAINTSCFVRLFATAAHIEMSGGGAELWFPKSDIIRLRRHSSTGLKIEHAVAGFPKLVIFMSRDFEELNAGLQALGYQVVDGDH